jgi:hypothetical protein
MDRPTASRRIRIRHRALFAHAACAALLLLATGAQAASIYKCVGADGRLAFRDTPCATDAQQTKLDVSGLPLMDPDAPRHAVASRTPRSSTHRHTRPASARKRERKQPMSWECRAADGEVFYRHTACPGSVPGDGVVRWQDGGDSASGKRSRHRRNAWGAVSVRGVKIPRAEACRRIHSAGAAVRDGHQRDAHVSTYDRLMGRGPCAGV